MFSLNPLPAALKLEMPSEAFLHISLISLYTSSINRSKKGEVLKLFAKVILFLQISKFRRRKDSILQKNPQKFAHVKKKYYLCLRKG